ncbi:rhomboid family intramembrane serine protease [uncultured Cytophaga sp.]|uniref:rhomboid family intramembrane serine protease n=1 Tax=uncultured Cytophaga sp. TaxID=160238 RepID=UPI00262B8FD1|nr:rhomboid family intramembrane serine protease [uncultured Cytophaga sp.]
MNETSIIALILILINLLVTYQGLRSQVFFDRFKFEVDRILIHKEYKRIVTSGFLHVGWMHFASNMYTLYAFSGSIENYLGIIPFILIYFASLIGSSLFSLFVHRNHGDYTAVGASGAVSGIVFASIVLFPGMGIGFLFLPIHIPAWLFGLVYVVYTIYGVKSKRDNIGHEAHLGGLVIGVLIALMLQPSAIITNTFTVLAILLPAIGFIAFVLLKPQALLIDNLYFKNHDQHLTMDHRYNQAKASKQKEIDTILDKISNKGMSSLSEKEKRALEEYSNR